MNSSVGSKTEIIAFILFNYLHSQRNVRRCNERAISADMWMLLHMSPLLILWHHNTAERGFYRNYALSCFPRIWDDHQLRQSGEGYYGVASTLLAGTECVTLLCRNMDVTDMGTKTEDGFLCLNYRIQHGKTSHCFLLHFQRIG
jgi:hypothetical protein